MDLTTSLKIAATGLNAQTQRMRVIAENIANAESTATKKGGDPYRRRLPVFEAVLDETIGGLTVKTAQIKRDQSPFGEKFEPSHLAANEMGYIKMPNVKPLVEMMDMRQAQRSYEANLNVISSARTMLSRTLDILKA